MIPSVEELEEALELPVKFFTIAFTYIDETLMIHHICTYPQEPTESDTLYLMGELRSDEEFKLEPEILNDIRLTTIPVADYIILRENLILLKENQ